MNYLADNNAKSERYGFSDPDAYDPIPGLRVFLSERAITAALDERLKSRVQIVDLLFGPFDFSL